MRFMDTTLKKTFLSTCEHLTDGQLTLCTPEGETYHFGTRGAQAEMNIRDWSAVSAFSAYGDAGLGVAYAQQLWDTPSVEGVMRSFIKNRNLATDGKGTNTLRRGPARAVDRVLGAKAGRQIRNDARGHSRIGNEFYQLWLDEGMTYSSAIFDGDEDDLNRGQTRKNARVLSKLGSGGCILEVGCGWGSFAEHAATRGRDVTGVTMSRDQHAYAESRLDGRADLRLGHYRDIEGRFDNIISIEAADAFGRNNWPDLLNTLKHKLADDGCIVLQTLTVPDEYSTSSEASENGTRRNVLSDHALLSDQMIAEQAKRAGLRVIETDAFGPDYAKTFRIWARRLTAKREAVSKMGYSERVFRSWQYRLESRAATYAVGQANVAQVQLVHE